MADDTAGIISPRRWPPAHATVSEKATPPGLEQPPKTPGKTDIQANRNAEYDALLAKSNSADPHLAKIVERWPALSDAIKARILEMVEDGR